MRRSRTQGGRRFRVRLAPSVIRCISMLPTPSRVIELVGVQAWQVLLVSRHATGIGSLSLVAR